VNISKTFLESIPIKKISGKIQDEFIKLINKEVELREKLIKLKDKTTDEKEKIEKEIQKLDEEIDKGIYRIYGLTKEEIKIIDKNFEEK